MQTQLVTCGTAPHGTFEVSITMTKRALAALLFTLASPLACKSTTAANPVLLTANVADPNDLNAVSDFNSCIGHAFNGNNSAKNYFWPNSTNFSTNGVVKLFAACNGITSQNSDDTNDPQEFTRGQSIHLSCDNSSTALRYFHITYPPGSLGQHVTAGAFLGTATMVGNGQTPSNSWQYSSNFDIAVVEGEDDRSENYFSKLDGPTFAAWAARGVTSVSQTIVPGNPNCTSYNANVGGPGIFVFTPAH